ncbi:MULTISPECIES: beta-ketoacyl-ACP synthase III [unclassified Streptomyces]|uniref:beta-ketoacyl-ACP synthase III n=1 Tax=unclassified Streptomyces TaxID=2593676 RepID=UPI0037F9B81C
MITKPLRATPAVSGSRIVGIGAYRPARVVGNDEICARIDSSDEWIRRRSGIVSRRFAADDETVISMAAEAAVKAMAHAGVDPADIGMVLLASMSHLEQAPAAAPRVAHRIGSHAAAATDIGAACAGFCYALALADSLVRSGSVRHVLVIGAEKMSDIIDPEDRGTAFIFGDGAGAAVVGPAETPGIGPVVWGADGERHGLIAHDRSWLDTREGQGPWPVLRMAGPEVFRWATRQVPEISRQALDAAGVTVHDLAAFIPHQANERIVDSTAKALRLAPHTVVAKGIVDSGNTSAASVPLAMDSLLSQGAVPSGSHALLVGFGAGLVHAAQVVTLP